LTAIAKQEERKRTVQGELEKLERIIRPEVFDEKRLKALLISRMEDFKKLMLGDVPNARKALQVLLGEDNIQFSPVMRDGKKTLSFSGKTKAGALLAPAFALQLSMAAGVKPDNHIRMASPRGFEPRYSP
jgi:hypothetical protein